jgi:hypothetical protein
MCRPKNFGLNLVTRRDQQRLNLQFTLGSNIKCVPVIDLFFHQTFFHFFVLEHLGKDLPESKVPSWNVHIRLLIPAQDIIKVMIIVKV